MCSKDRITRTHHYKQRFYPRYDNATLSIFTYLLAQSPYVGIKVSFAGTPSHLKKEHTTSRGGLDHLSENYTFCLKGTPYMSIQEYLCKTIFKFKFSFGSLISNCSILVLHFRNFDNSMISTL